MFLKKLSARLMPNYLEKVLTSHWLSVRVILGDVGIPGLDFCVPFLDNLNWKEPVKVIEDLSMLHTGLDGLLQLSQKLLT